MRVTATEAKNRFGSRCAQAKRGPLALRSNHNKAGRAARKKAFEAEYGDWIAAQNAWFETQGIPGADLRPW
jgi:hypothetical protein